MIHPIGVWRKVISRKLSYAKKVFLKAKITNETEKK